MNVQPSPVNFIKYDSQTWFYLDIFHHVPSGQLTVRAWKSMVGSWKMNLLLGFGLFSGANCWHRLGPPGVCRPEEFGIPCTDLASGQKTREILGQNRSNIRNLIGLAINNYIYIYIIYTASKVTVSKDKRVSRKITIHVSEVHLLALVVAHPSNPGRSESRVSIL